MSALKFDPSVLSPAKRRRLPKGKKRGVLADLLNKGLKEFPELEQEVWDKCKQFFTESCEYAIEDCMGAQSREWRLSPSGFKCARAEWLKRMKKPCLRDDSKYPVFLAGRIAEAWTRVYCWMLGLDVFGFEYEVTVPVPGRDPVKGHLDMFYRDDDGRVWVVDIKSINGYGFRDIKAGKYGDLWNYKKQVQLYTTGLFESGEIENLEPTPLLLFITKETWREYVEMIVTPITDKTKGDWANFAKDVHGRRLPRKPSWAKTRLMPRAKRNVIDDPRCRYCEYIKTCWGAGCKENTPGKKDWYLPVSGKPSRHKKK